MKTAYTLYRQGGLSKGQYDYRRKKALNSFSHKLGPFERLLMKGKTAPEAIRITRSKVLPATKNIDTHLSRLSQLARYTKHGGVVLTAAGLASGCYDIAKASTRQEKNEIFVETLTSTGFGFASGAALGVFFFSNPVGWGTALVLGVGSASASYGAGKGLTSFYNRFGNKVDLVKMASVDKLCK